MFEFIDKIKDRYRQNRVEKLLNVQKSLCEIEERIEELSKAQSHKYIRKEPDGKGGWNYIYEEDKKVSNKKEENDIIILNKDENILINDAYYLRFQDDTKIQTSVHPYPTKEIINLYRNQDKVKEAIKRVDNGEIEWDDLLNFYDTEDFRFKEGYVASLRFDNENEIKVTNQNFQTAPSASDKYVMLFEGDYEDEYNIFDGIVTKMKNIKAIYEKSKDGYKLIEKDGKKVKINNITEKSFSNDYISELAQLKLNKNKLLKSEQSLKNEDPLFKSMYDHMKFEATYKEVTKGYRQGQINLDRCDEILKAINNDKKVKYSDNLVFNSEGKLLLLKRSELDKTFPGMYTIPGGHVDAGEDHRTAAIRELQEESGLTPDKDSQFTKVGEYEDDKVCIEYFRSLVDKDNDTLTLQSEEAWQYEWVDPRELDKYEFPLNMKQNIQKILYPSKEVIVKLGKAFKNGKITREKFIAAVDVLSKAYSHKYISKKSDGKGGWEYEYEEEKGKGESKVIFEGSDLGKDYEKTLLDLANKKIKELGIKENITFKFTKQNSIFGGGVVLSTTPKKITEIKISNSQSSHSKLIVHELTHVKQINNGELYLKGDNIIFKDNIVMSVKDYKRRFSGKWNEKKINEYKNLPWEKEAFDSENELNINNKDGYIEIEDNTEKSLQSINELYLQNRMSDELYETIIEKAWKKSPIGTITTRSNGQKYKKVSETGNKDQDWQLVSKPKAGGKTDEPVSKEKRAEYGTKGKQPTISEHAKESSETALNAAIKESQDPEVREAAHQELDRRQKEEHVQEEEKKDGGEKNEDILKKKIEDLSNKYKNVMQEIFKPENYNNEENYKKIEKKQLEISRYIGRSNQFNGLDNEKEIKAIKDLLQLKDEKEIKSFFGDGDILGVKKQGDMTCMILMEDGYCSRTFFEDGGVKMNEFILDLDVDKSKGKGTEIFSNQVKSFKEKGYKYLKTEAVKSEIYNGYYTWARLGYDIANEEGKKKFKSVVGKSKDKDILQVKSLPELMSFQKGRDFWKQNGFQFEGKFDLLDKSKSMFILNKYVEEKKNAKK